jgi:hypothetical protein
MNLGKDFLIFPKISYEWFNRLMNPFQRLGDFLVVRFSNGLENRDRDSDNDSSNRGVLFRLVTLASQEAPASD